MRPIVLLIGVVVLLGAACGGGDSGRLSQAEFQQRANRICKDLDAKLEAQGEAETAEELQQQLEEGEREIRSSLDELRALQPPEELEEDYDRFLVHGDQLADLVADLKQAAQEQDSAELEQLSARGDSLDEESDEVANRIGLDECGND